ncbi:MAG: FkbM family methyltransferase, partial [Burkholderiales bacterium]|nr:FkbM family methyltransferase [Burkholderiales bacterium]
MTTIVKTQAGRFIVFENDALGKVLLTKGDFEPHFLQLARQIVRPGDLCLDLGANLGYHSVTLARLTGPDGVVLAFEPQRLIFQQLCGNSFLNDLRNIHVFNAAVGAVDGMVQMDAVDYDHSQVNIGGTKVGQGGATATMMRLDALKREAVKFLKLDIQGCEENFLTGAAATIAKSRPVMFVEIEEYLLRYFGSSSERLLNRLLAMNYVLVRILNDYPCDHLAVPAEQAHLLPGWLKDLRCPHVIIQGRAVRVTMDHP